MGLGQKMWDKLQAVDLDSTFAYSTPKVVVIKDRYLGGLRLCFMLGITLYFIISSMIINKAYMAFEDVSSLIHMSHYFNPTPTALPAYCVGGPNVSDVAQLPCDTFPYAWKVGPTSSYRKMFLTLPWGPIVADTLMVTTAISPASFSAPATNLTDTNLSLTNATDRYTLSPEDGYTKVYWAAQAGTLALAEIKAGGANLARYRARSGPALKMRLLDSMGKVLVDDIDGSEGCYAFKTLDLLTSANVDPDRQQTMWTKDTTKPLRYGGFSLSMRIKCSTASNGGFKDCDASVVFDDIIQTYFIPPYPEIGINRTEYRRGFLLKVSVAGKMGRSDLMQFMLAWVACAAMFGLSTVLTDFVLANLLPLSNIYTKMTTEETCNFSRFRKCDDKAVEAVRAIRIATYSKSVGMREAERRALMQEAAEREFLEQNQNRCCYRLDKAVRRVSSRMSSKELQVPGEGDAKEDVDVRVPDLAEVEVAQDNGLRLGVDDKELIARFRKLEVAQKELMQLLLAKPALAEQLNIQVDAASPLAPKNEIAPEASIAPTGGTKGKKSKKK